MKLKQRVGDFRVRELLVNGFLQAKGPHRVYRVTKRKLTTPEAVRAVADLAGVQPNEVSLAGLKDRQGITIQHVSVPKGRDLRIQEQELKVETAGFSEVPVTSRASRGNAFEIGVRALSGPDVQRLRDNLPLMRSHGVVNYFDDQRFGNLEFGQGWIMLDLLRGEPEKALRSLLTGSSDRDDDHHLRFKSALNDAWGDWRACRDIAGKFGAHHSIFEHLGRQPEDFAGAFEHVATRVKTIHLFAYQSHLWNRAVADLVRGETQAEERVAMRGIEGPLISWAGARPAALRGVGEFPLPGPGLDDVTDAKAYGLLENVLAKSRLVPDQLRVEGISGFHLKGEMRQLTVIPEHLRVRPAEPDALNRGLRMVRVRFELPRGAYATLAVKRLLALAVGEDAAQRAEAGQREGRRTHAPGRYGVRPASDSRSGSHSGANPWASARSSDGGRNRDRGAQRPIHPKGGGRGPAESPWGASPSSDRKRGRSTAERASDQGTQPSPWGRNPRSGRAAKEHTKRAESQGPGAPDPWRKARAKKTPATPTAGDASAPPGQSTEQIPDPNPEPHSEA